MKTTLTKACAVLALCVGLLALSSAPALAQNYSTAPPVDSGATAEEILAAIQANNAAAALSAAEAAAAAAAAAAAGDEVLGVTQTAGGAGGNLAFTGSEVSVPAAAGAGLIALGGIALLASRKRQG